MSHGKETALYLTSSLNVIHPRGFAHLQKDGDPLRLRATANWCSWFVCNIGACGPKGPGPFSRFAPSCVLLALKTNYTFVGFRRTSRATTSGRRRKSQHRPGLFWGSSLPTMAKSRRSARCFVPSLFFLQKAQQKFPGQSQGLLLGAVKGAGLRCSDWAKLRLRLGAHERAPWEAERK